MNRMSRAAGAALAALTLTTTLLTATAFAGPPSKGKKKPPVVDKAAIAAGKKVYDGNGCANCHAINGTGGMAGPDLTKVGANPKHTAKWLAEAIVNPKAHNPDTTMPSYEDSIKGKDLTNVVAYLASLKK